jgi:hypothetical protein
MNLLKKILIGALISVSTASVITAQEGILWKDDIHNVVKKDNILKRVLSQTEAMGYSEILPVAIGPDGRQYVLFSREGSNGKATGTYCGCGGKVDPRETMEQGSLREFYEESARVYDWRNRTGFLKNEARIYYAGNLMTAFAPAEYKKRQVFMDAIAAEKQKGQQAKKHFLEKDDYQWVSVDSLLWAVNKLKWGQTDVTVQVLNDNGTLTDMHIRLRNFFAKTLKNSTGILKKFATPNNPIPNNGNANQNLNNNNNNHIPNNVNQNINNNNQIPNNVNQNNNNNNQIPNNINQNINNNNQIPNNANQNINNNQNIQIHQNIEVINSLKKIDATKFKKGTLLLLDLDENIIIERKYTPAQYKGLIPAHQEYRLIEPDIAQTIKKLKESVQGDGGNVTVLALTKRGLDKPGHHHLKKENIEVSRKKFKNYNGINLCGDNNAGFVEGVIYTNGKNKGDFLKDFLKKTGCKPSKFVMSDDKDNNLKNVQELAKKMNIPMHAYRMDGVKNLK